MKAAAVFELMTYRSALTQCPTPKGNNIEEKNMEILNLILLIILIGSLSPYDVPYHLNSTKSFKYRPKSLLFFDICTQIKLPSII